MIENDILLQCEEAGIDIVSCKKCSIESQDHVPMYMLRCGERYVFVCAVCFKKTKEFKVDLAEGGGKEFKERPETPSIKTERKKTIRAPHPTRDGNQKTTKQD